MLEKLKERYNILLGVITGFILAQFIIVEGYAVLIGLQQKEGKLYIELNHNIILKIQLLALLVFIITILIFCTKRFKNINFNRISIYITSILILSAVITFEALILIGVLVSRYFSSITNYVGTNYFVSINALFITIVIGGSIFFTIFILLLNRKVEYIKFLTKEVKVIKKDGFGKLIEVRGKDELADLCKSINDMSIELAEKIENEKRIEKVKSELITNISHDLKTPLTSIVGYLEILNSGNIDIETKDKYIGIAYNKSLRLKELVNDLFEYTKLTSPDFKINKNRVNLVNLINQIVGESIFELEVKGIKVVLDNPYREIYSNIDIKLFSRVIENLIKNVEKYSDRDSDLNINVRVKESLITISFINKCELLSDEVLNKIFDKFYRGDEARTLENEGSGLGLSISKRIIELHNGDLEAKKVDDYIEFSIKIGICNYE